MILKEKGSNHEKENRIRSTRHDNGTFTGSQTLPAVQDNQH